jgi:hypothetical protein
MTPPDNGPPAAGGGLLKKLTPKQKKYALVIGAAAVLAMIALLSKRGAPEEAPAESEGEAQPREVAGLAPVAAGATDPTAFLGAQSEDVTAALGGVSDALGGVSGGLEGVTLGQDELGDQYMRGDEGDRDRDEATLGAIGGTAAGIQSVKKMLKAQREREQKARQRKSGGGKKGGNKASQKPKAKHKKAPHPKPKKHRKPRR